MRLERTCVLDADREDVWEVIADTGNWLRIMHELTQFEREEDRGQRAEEEDTDEDDGSGLLGQRFTMRMRVGSADIGGLVEIVECDEPGDLAWTSITGIDQRGRWRLRETEDGRTRVTLRLSYGAPGGILAMIADRVSAPMVAGNLKQTLENLRKEVEGDVDGEEPGMSLPARVLYELGSLRILAEAGVIRPMRPDRLLRVGLALARFGRSPAAGAIALAQRYPDEPMIVDELGTLSFRDVDLRTNALAHALSDAGIVEGDGVGIMCRNHRGFIEATIAISKLGADALYLNTAFAGPQLTEVVKREKPRAIVYDEEFAELLEDAGKRRKRFIAWHDSEDPADPTLDELIEGATPRASSPRSARAAR